MNNKITDRLRAAALSKPEGGERPSYGDRVTDIYQQSAPGERYAFAERLELRPLAAVNEIADRYDATPQIVRNLFDCDLWQLEGAEDGPHRIATVWRPPGHVEAPPAWLEVG